MSVAQIPPEHCVEGPADRRQDANGDEGVHGHRPMAGTADGADVEGPCRPPHDRSGQGDDQPLPPRETEGGHQPEGDREVAQRHEQRSSHDQAAAERPGAALELIICDGGGARLPDRPRRVPGGRHLFDDPIDRDGTVDHHRGPLAGQVDPGRHAIHPIEASLDAGGAGAARHATQCQGDRDGVGHGTPRPAFGDRHRPIFSHPAHLPGTAVRCLTVSGPRVSGPGRRRLRVHEPTAAEPRRAVGRARPHAALRGAPTAQRRAPYPGTSACRRQPT